MSSLIHRLQNSTVGQALSKVGEKLAPVRTEIARAGVYAPAVGQAIGGPLGNLIGTGIGAYAQTWKPGNRDEKVAGLKRVGEMAVGSFAVGETLNAVAGQSFGASGYQSIASIFGGGSAASVKPGQSPASVGGGQIPAFGSSQQQPVNPGGRGILSTMFGGIFGASGNTQGQGKGGKGGIGASGGIWGALFGGGSSPGSIPNDTPATQDAQSNMLKLGLLIGGGFLVIMALRKG